MGRLIVIEGIDGAGKRTLAEKLTAALRGRERAWSSGRSRATARTCTPT